MAELLAVPLKRSSDVDIVKPLKNLIQSTYSSSESTEDYTEALNELNRLRTNAIWKVFEKASLDVIYSYYDQLVSLESKVPPQEVQIPFKWKDAFDKGSLFGGRISLTVSSLAYERVCVLFNMAAAQSGVAAAEALDTEDSLKLAAKLFQQAAGIFSYLKSNVLLAIHQQSTPDLQPDALAALTSLMLAQAQEVIAYKCIRDEMKESMIAKVCAQCEEWYLESARGLQREPLRQHRDPQWETTVAAKQLAMRALAHYYQSLVCRANKMVGEEISRLQFASEQLKLAQQKMNSTTFFQDYFTKIKRNLAEATKDNDFIYHERIPEVHQLEPLPRAPVAKPLPVPERWTQNKDLFGGLLPARVHLALQAAGARRDDQVAQHVAELRDATALLNSILASLNLPACIEAPSAGGLPASIQAKARFVRERGGLPALQQLMRELPDLLTRNKEILTEAERMLDEEEQADDALRNQFGARWTRTPSRKLTEAFRANAAKYAQIIDNAVRADNIVQEKYNTHKDNMSLLGGSEAHISAGLPHAAAAASNDAPLADKLRRLCDQVESLKGERDALESELKDVTLDMKDKFLSALADGALDEPALSAGALGAALAPLVRRVRDSVATQQGLVAEIQEAHSALMAARGGADTRDAALAALCAAHDAYSELSANLQEGAKFYNDLTQLLVQFQNKISDFCFARRTEKEELLKDLTQDAARQPAPAHAPSQEPAAVKKEAPPRPPPPSAPGAAPAPPAPQLPYPAQPQGMPLPYGAPPAYPYYAPMPAMYNPYATLPYPHHRAPQPAAPQPAAPAYQPYQYPPGQFPYPPPAGYNPYPPQQ